MTYTVKSELVNINTLKTNPKLLKEYTENQRIALFKQLDIKDNQPVVLVFKSSSLENLYANLADPLGDVHLTTTVKVDYPQIKNVIVNKSISEEYKEHTGFWSKLKLLFSKKPVYTKSTKEDFLWD